jgi:hypothetical protein
MNDRPAGECGQTLLLVVGLTVVTVLLVTVVANVSRAFLAERALAAAADGAAAAGASAIDENAAYVGGLAGALPLDPAGVESEVATYVELADLDRQFDGFEVVQASTDGTTVIVRLSARVGLPLATLLSHRYAEGYPIEVTARARAPVSPAR